MWGKKKRNTVYIPVQKKKTFSKQWSPRLAFCFSPWHKKKKMGRKVSCKDRCNWKTVLSKRVRSQKTRKQYVGQRNTLLACKGVPGDHTLSSENKWPRYKMWSEHVPTQCPPTHRYHHHHHWLPRNVQKHRLAAQEPPVTKSSQNWQ